MDNFWAAVEQHLQKEISINEPEYRLYYDVDTNLPLFYTMEKPDGQYINITHAEYSRGNYNVKIVNGKIKELANNITKLVQADFGTACHVNDISIIADANCSQQIWNLKTNE